MITRQIACAHFPSKPLGDVADFLDSRRKPVKQADRKPGPYPYYGANGQQGTIDGYLFDEPLLLLAEDGGFFDQPDRGIAYRISGKTWVNNHAHVIRPKDGLDIGFLYRTLESYDVRPYINGSTRSKLTKTQASQIVIPLPPLDEQKRIAAILDQADSLRCLRQRALDKLNTLGQSIFYEMFGDPITNPLSWETRKLSGVGSLDRGVSKHRPRNAPALLGGEHPLIQTGDVSRAGDYITEHTSTYSELGLSQSKKWKAGVLCITIAANIADTAILSFDACFPDSVVGFDGGDVSANFYVHTWFKLVKGELERIAPAVAQKNINLGILRGLDIIWPGSDLIKEFHQRTMVVRSNFEESVKARHSLNTLFSSLQQRAFKGEL